MRTRNDLRLYDDHAAEWWDPGCRTFRSLHAVTGFHLELLQHWLREAGGPQPRTVVDLGCGGGFMAVPLAERGARVICIDVSAGSLRAIAARGVPGCVPVRADLADVPLCAESADLTLLADVLEHVPEPGAALAEAARILRPGGHLFASTLNRTLSARLLAVTLGEGLGLVPRGTHDPRMFLRPDELDAMARDVGLTRLGLAGEALRPWRTLRDRTVRLRRGRSTAVGYSAFYRREPR